MCLNDFLTALKRVQLGFNGACKAVQICPEFTSVKNESVAIALVIAAEKERGKKRKLKEPDLARSAKVVFQIALLTDWSACLTTPSCLPSHLFTYLSLPPKEVQYVTPCLDSTDYSIQYNYYNFAIL